MKAGEKSASFYLIVDGECTLYTANDLSSKFIPLKLLGEEGQLAAQLTQKHEEDKQEAKEKLNSTIKTDMFSQAASSKYESPFKDSKRVNLLNPFSKRLKFKRDSSPFL